MLTTTLPSTGDVVLNHKPEKKELILNLLHYVPQRKAVGLDTIEEIIPIHDVKVSVKLDRVLDILDSSREIESVMDVQKHQELEYGIEDSELTFVIPIVEGYQITVIKYK